jgi:hypothetical protein
VVATYAMFVREMAYNGFDGGPAQKARLMAEDSSAQGPEPEARWLLDHIGIEHGWRAADIGAAQSEYWTCCRIVLARREKL